MPATSALPSFATSARRASRHRAGAARHSQLLAEPVSLHDIADAEGFVAKTILRSITADPASADFEDLKAEGLAILCKLAADFEPHRPGYAQAGRFSGYAAAFLPKRLGDAWHRMHPNHRYVTGADGKRVWRYDPPPLSLDALVDADEDNGHHAGGDGVLTRARGLLDFVSIPTPVATGMAG